METVKFFIIVGSLGYLITCVALLDIARKDFWSFKKKFLWIGVASLPFIGFILYFAFGFRKGKTIDQLSR